MDEKIKTYIAEMKALADLHTQMGGILNREVTIATPIEQARELHERASAHFQKADECFKEILREMGHPV